jgi:signal transduction histidine kinase
MDFSRKEEFQNKEEADLRELIEQDMRLMKKQLETARIDLKIAGAKALSLQCYPGQLSQVFINLVCNAIDAMKASPTKHLTIHIESCTGDAAYCRHGAPLRCRHGKSCAIVSFIDTGCGIPEELREKIFEPFVTTKGVLAGGDSSTPGTGLGLFISYGIVQRHGGAIFAQPSGGIGSKLTVILPVTE